jgi:hypothetical protein
MPTIYDTTFEIQLNSWYNCDAKGNSRLDQAMDYRRKMISLNLDFISDKPLIFNLHHFTFENEQKTISGVLRWIPKMVSNNERNKDKITNIDHFQTLTNMDLIPLTRSRLEQVMHANHSIPTIDEDSDGNDSLFQPRSNENGDDDPIETPKEVNSHFCIPNTIYSIFSTLSFFSLAIRITPQ